MRIRNLHLKNYRNYKTLDVEFSDGLNIFIGNNAQGKSNILESIFVLSLTKSYMNIKDKYLIKEGESFGLVKASFFARNVKKELEVIICENSKKLKINGIESKKYSDYILELKVLIFSPYNVNFIKDGPAIRRKTINMVISQFTGNYVKLLQQYNAVLKKRNQILKTVDFFKDYNNIYFDALNERFSRLAVEIVLERFKYVSLINNFLRSIYLEITGYDNLVLEYITNVKLSESKEDMIEDFNAELKKMLDKEKRYGISLIGPHRDDFSFLLDGKDLSIFGSQGQIRSAILALKLSELSIFKEKDGEYPILLLDDIFSELDVDKRNKIIKYISNDVQTIITTTDINLIDNDLVNRASIFVVNDGSIMNDRKKECNDE